MLARGRRRAGVGVGAGAEAGAEFVQGREGPEQYGESLARDVPKGGDHEARLLAGVEPHRKLG